MAMPLSDFFSRTRSNRFLNAVDLPHILLCFLIIAAHIFFLGTGRLERAENNLLDFYLRQSNRLPVHPAIVLIEIDKDSLQAIGPWPWPWKYHAEILKILYQWQAKAVIPDLIFKAETPEDQMDAFDRALGETDSVYFPVSLESKTGKKFYIHSLPIELEPENEKKIWRHSVPSIERHARGIGHKNIFQDSDGVVRRIDPYLSYGGESYLYLPLKAAYEFLGEDVPSPGNLSLPLDIHNRLMIRWPGAWREAFRRYSFADIIRSAQAVEKGITPAVGPEQIRGKICLIGITASEMGDFKITPTEAVVPSIAVHAAVMNNLLTGRYLKPASFFVNTLALCLMGFFAALLFIAFRSVSSFVAGLLLAGGWLGGSFWLFWQKGFWIDTVQPLLLILSLFIASAIYTQIVFKKEQNRLFDLATRDGLTGLYVIRHFREILNKVVIESQLKKQPLSVILIDIDNFKKINDTFGHPAGDKVLKKGAEVISACFRSHRSVHEIDFAARYGGEEIIVMVRNAGLKEAALNVAERIRKAVEQTPFEWEGSGIPVTISLGVATLHAGENVPDLMVRRADEALYRAKRAGKNQVCMEGVAG